MRKDLTFNTDHKAQKLKILAKAGLSTSEADTFYRYQDGTGGFGFNWDYFADPLTTAKVVQAFHATDYRHNVEISQALYYLISTQRFDGGWSVSEWGDSPIGITAEVVEALLPWQDGFVGQVSVAEAVNLAVNSFISTQDTDGTWGGDLLDTALAYHTIKAAGKTPTYHSDTIKYFITDNNQTHLSLIHISEPTRPY